jgi:hypothetical protein
MVLVRFDISSYVQAMKNVLSYGLKINLRHLSMNVDAVPRIYDGVSDLVATCQIAAFIEPVNAAFKLVHTGVFAPLMQVHIVCMVFRLPV